MQRTLALLIVGGAAAAMSLVACGGGDEPPLFQPKPECQGDPTTPFTGQATQVISKLEIGNLMDGFDLDGDGKPDNKLAGVGSLAGSSITDSLNKYDLLIPVEMFDFRNVVADTCVKFNLYLGIFKTDGDGDGKDTAVDKGDCNDHDPDIKPGATEVPGNGKDDDCDGLADEINDGPDQMPSTAMTDADHDGVTIAQGDCDDTNPVVKGPNFPEICGDGYDNDCDGQADRHEDAQGNVTQCNPFDATPDDITVDPRSFDEQGKPLITFTSGEVAMADGKLQLTAGPSLFQVAVPVTNDIVLTLKITGTTIVGDVEMDGDRPVIKNGRLGGVIDARTADTLRGLTIDAINLTPDQSLLDAIFGNALGALLALPAKPPGDKHAGCRSPDIDVDRDGLEVFCDTNADGDPNTKVVDLCVDGDGTEVRDTVVNGQTVHCTEALDKNGKPRFVDGISVELNFETAPANLKMASQ